MLNHLLNDPEILTRYQAIETMEEDTGGWAYHNLTHVKHVTLLTEQILRALNQDESFIEEAKIAALLHDIGSLEGKAGHAKRSYDYAKHYFKTHPFNLKYEDQILKAIKHHSDGFQTDDLMTLVLILADKLDITKQRLAPAGYEVVGLNEIQFIKQIQVEIMNETLHVNFIAHPQFNQKAFEDFYFAKKVFKAIKSFSKQLNLNYQIKLNHQNWNMT